MIDKGFSAQQARQAQSNVTVFFALATVMFFFMATGYVSYSNTSVLNSDAKLVTHTHEVITTLADLESLLKDAETGQRGYVLTGDEKYLAPYNNAVTRIKEQITELTKLTADNAPQQGRIPGIEAHINAKLAELLETINLRREKGFEAARAVVVTDRGKAEMDEVRLRMSVMIQQEQILRSERIKEMQRAYWTAVSSGILTAFLGILLSYIILLLVRRAAKMRERQEWLQSGEVGMAKAMLGDKNTLELGQNALKFLVEYLGAHAGVFFIKEGDFFRRVSTYGVAADGKTPEHFDFTDGLLGQAAQDGKTFLISDVPEGYLTVGSGLGQGAPRHLIISPAGEDGSVNAVIELGFLHPLKDQAIELLEQTSGAVAVAVKSANYRVHLQNLLEETQRQSEELQAQSEELRVSNEELEEQSRALKESQVRLEQQQAELEQTNSQLEEQTQMLESQKDDLERSRQAVVSKARELEQASQYKSDFLANMSHELRTPLNSSLILAKLLADNGGGNLTQEQIKFAKTIQSSGNDLLMLINDILDLSKIEAGHMELRAETISLDRMIKDLSATFEPLSKQKNLNLKIELSPKAPKTIETDRQRLEQVLKNLMSNAIKFTDKGSVTLTIAPAEDKKIIFSVTDTGIGVSAEQQQVIFEAFRQADGTISRKYGGTGLGLSISRELTRLLGGAIELKSTPGEGSTFNITIPQVYDASETKSYKAPKNNAINVTPIKEETTPASLVRPHREDDRDNLNKGDRSILVIEDDTPFADILYDLAHQMNFKCLLAASAEEGLSMARQYTPSAVLLDVSLPDNSGLSVLDRLKRNVRTRHIPVHVVSALDYTQTAMSLGAVGYMIKPVKREELVQALEALETKFSQRLRKVLIVEDDAVQRDSMMKLLGTHEVETHAVGTAAECLEKLKDSTFDCMVLDLSLPDASGYSLLETLSKEESYSFPPVIVYTGRDLSVDEEQRLRRYSKSIIIKGAKSPERLLDEVTLFLHQVVSELPPEQQKMLEQARNRDTVLENRRILVVEDDVANIYALSSILEPRGVSVVIARNGREALDLLEKSKKGKGIDLVLMDMMMPEMDGITATRTIRQKSEWKKLPIIMLTAKAMRDDQERCLEAGANDYMAKPLDVEKLLSLVRVWMPR